MGVGAAPAASVASALHVRISVLEGVYTRLQEGRGGRANFRFGLRFVPSGTDRVVFDRSALDRLVTACLFQMVTVSQVRLHITPGMWMASLDLNKAYRHIPIHPWYWKFLAFQPERWTLQFNVLPFGSSLAP